MLDVGANIGTFTLPLLAAGVNVVSFEASPQNAALLSASAEALRTSLGRARSGRSIIVGGKALASSSTPRTVCITAKETAFSNRGGVINNHGALRVELSEAPSSRSSRRCLVRVPTTTVAAELEAHLGRSARVLAAKVDVEGAEREVMGGWGGRPLPRLLYLESANDTWVRQLVSKHGYAVAARRDGCDTNWKLVRRMSRGDDASNDNVNEPWRGWLVRRMAMATGTK